MIIVKMRKLVRFMNRQDLETIMGIIGIFLFVIVAIFAPLLAPYPEGYVDINNTLQPPSLKHPFGTDNTGYDNLNRVIYGSRVSLKIAGTTMVLVLCIGVLLGLIAGSTRKPLIRESIMRIADLFLCFPHLLLAMTISTLLGPSLRNAVIAMSIAWWPWYTRVAYTLTLSVVEEDYIEAARAVGASRIRIIFKYILPNVISPLFIQASLDMGGVIIVAASLGFLGIGAQPPTPEWGLMISSARSYFLTHPWLVIFPGLAIFLSVLSFNLLGDGLREMLDPRMRRMIRQL